MGVATVLAIASLVIAAGSAYVSYKQNAAMASDRRKAAKVQGAENAAAQQQNIRNQVRQDRIKRAQILQSSENTGVSMSSGSLGASSAMSTQIGSNIGIITRQGNSSSAIGAFNQSAADHGNRAQTWAQASSLASSSFSMFSSQPGAQDSFKNWFSQ